MGKRSDERRRVKREAERAAPLGRRESFKRVKACVVGIVNAPADIDAVFRKVGQSQANAFAPLQVIGSGFVFDENGTIITAKHVVQPWIDASAQLKPGQTIPPPRILFAGPAEEVGTETRWGMFLGTVLHVASDKNRDVAALRLFPIEPAMKMAIHPARLSNVSPEEGDEIAVCGYPLGNALHKDLFGGLLLVPSFAGGIVSAVLPFSGVSPKTIEAIQVSAMVNPGNSGGPAFDVRTGEVMGMVVSMTTVDLRRLAKPGQPPPVTPPEPTAPTGLARVIPLRFIRPLVERLPSAESLLAAPPAQP